MKQLDIKHIAPYLPYGLKGRYRVGDVLPHLSASQDVEREKILAIDSVDFFYKFCKPILYPLDYLTKEITHNGETFVPIERLHSLQNAVWIKNASFIENGIKDKDGTVFGFDSKYGGFIAYDDDFRQYSVHNQLELINKLFEWRFDVFNLMNDGLAIPVTETFNPYNQ